MKNTNKVFGIIVLVTIIGVSMIACNKSGGGGSSGGGGVGKTLNSPEELKAYLDKQPVNGPDKPIKVSMTINDPMLKNVADVIKSAGKYISLNISGNALTTIPYEAFDECETLVSITIPSSVTTTTIFDSCKNITVINVNSDNKNYSSDQGVLYNKDKTTLIRYPRKKVGTSFNIPNSVTTIGDFAFSYCTNLTSVTIPDSVTRIGEGTFGCESLTSVTFQGTISSDNFGVKGWTQPFQGDLRSKYLAGGIGTYTTSTPVPERYEWIPVWTKQ